VSKERPKILFAGGGTGGHVFPALAIADEIRKQRPNADIYFVGTARKIEAKIVPEKGYPFFTIWISGFLRKFTWENLLFPAKVIVSMMQSFSLIKRLKPDVVVGTGGYVCGPILYIASRLHIPTVVHESNSHPGVTTKILAQKATRVFTAFEATNKWLKRKDNVELVGTPVRPSLTDASKQEAMKYFNLHPERKTLLVFGGSLGATSLNSAVLGILQELQNAGAQLIWQTGQKDLSRIRSLVQASERGWVGPFIDRMDYAYAAADVVVCRAGATTIAEITALGKPAILVPYPFATGDHQTHNALALAEAGAAIAISDRELQTKLGEAVQELLRNDAKRRKMSEASRGLGRPRAGEFIASRILEFIN
jgi:UDP-N-acetylglucosamine--N-acetylmuramyl-(pentapeptide) pyrophosphoryl-undecaprenol N-acetylglucosamine transferase